MSWLLIRLVVCSALLLATVAASAQRRRNYGQALVVPPSRARYHRSPVFRDYYRQGQRAHYHYGPSFWAYYNRRSYQPRVYYSRRPAARRSPVATLRPRVAGQ